MLSANFFMCLCVWACICVRACLNAVNIYLIKVTFRSSLETAPTSAPQQNQNMDEQHVFNPLMFFEWQYTKMDAHVSSIRFKFTNHFECFLEVNAFIL